MRSSITVITEEDIQRKQERTLPDVLKDVPGLNVIKTGGPGGFTCVLILAGNVNKTKILLDRHRRDKLTPTHLASRGISGLGSRSGRSGACPQSQLYGADAIGGVINIITKRIRAAPVRGSLEGGRSVLNQNAGMSRSLGASATIWICSLSPSDIEVTRRRSRRGAGAGDSYDNKTRSQEVRCRSHGQFRPWKRFASSVLL